MIRENNGVASDFVFFHKQFYCMLNLIFFIKLGIQIRCHWKEIKWLSLNCYILVNKFFMSQAIFVAYPKQVKLSCIYVMHYNYIDSESLQFIYLFILPSVRLKCICDQSLHSVVCEQTRICVGRREIKL